MRICMVCPVNGTGYGIHGKNTLVALARVGAHYTPPINVVHFPIGHVDYGICTPEEQKIIDSLHFSRTDWNADDVSIRLWHEFDQHDFPTKNRWGFCVWELDKPIPFAIHQMGKLDGLLVPSQWQKRGALQAGVNTQVHVVPEGVDSNVFKPIPHRRGKRFRFIHIGKWEVRKNTYNIAKAFAELYGGRDDVEMVMWCHNLFFDAEVMAEKSKEIAELAPNIRVYENMLIRPEIVSAELNKAHCAVFASSAEGWCLPLMEAMACGLPVITTNVTGMSEYVTKENAYIIPHGDMVTAEDGWVFKGHGQWYDIPFEAIKETMEKAFEKGFTPNQKGIETAQEYSWENAAHKLIQIMNS